MRWVSLMISQNDFWNGKKFGIFTQPPEFFQMLREYLLESTLPKVVAHEMMMNSTSSYMVILCVSLRSLISIASLKKRRQNHHHFNTLNGDVQLMIFINFCLLKEWLYIQVCWTFWHSRENLFFNNIFDIENLVNSTSKKLVFLKCLEWVEFFSPKWTFIHQIFF